MQLLYGTYNPAKLDYMRRVLHGLPVTLIGLCDLDSPPPEVEEDGDTPLDNARIKALAYCAATGMTTVSADSALYIEGLSGEEQPAAHARRIDGKRLSDDEMIEHYADIARRLGGRAKARYRNGLCIAFADGRIAERFDDSVATRAFYMVDTPHTKRTVGFPIDSLSVEIESGKYYYDIEDEPAESEYPNGYRQFVQEALGL